MKNHVLVICLQFFVLFDLSTSQNANAPAAGCPAYGKAPAASTMKCTQTQCTATCNAKYKFPKGETTLSIDCVDKKWIMKNPKYKDQKTLPACEPICNPACANKGKCTAPNRCQCTADFQGATCREKACKQQPAATKNSKRVCKPTQCTVTCLPGFKFKTGATTMTLQCRNGNWASTSRGLSLTTHCEPHCNPPCQNGGKCTGSNKCECSDKFRGAQCQHAVDKCSPRKHGFNGSFGCMGSETEFSCSLECPENFKFDKTPAASYKCKFVEGKFTPPDFPKCLYTGADVIQPRSHTPQATAAKPASPPTQQTKPTSAPRPSPVVTQSPNKKPTCSPACQNGGTCVQTNKCQCPKNFAGPQCQYSVDRCSPQKIGFNGGFSCSGTQTGLKCTLMCPPEIDFEFTPADSYHCDFATGKFTPERVPKCLYGDSFQVVHRSDTQGKPDKMVARGPSCNPACQNGGTCIFADLCQCPKNFAGPQCQYSVDRCAPQKLGFNGGVRCAGTQTGMNCIIYCPEGINFDFTPASVYACDYSTGIFSPSRIPKCVYGEGVQVIQQVAEDDDEEETPHGATCNPPCRNGGSCVFTNMCQCPQKFRGPQCQYPVERCSIKNTSFNGGFKCSGTATEMVCTLNCPAGVSYEFPPAAKYTCKYETGQFTPSPIPNCVYGEGVEVIRRNKLTFE